MYCMLTTDHIVIKYVLTLKTYLRIGAVLGGRDLGMGLEEGGGEEW